MFNNLIPSLKDTIWGNASGIVQNIIEISIDSIIENELLKEIPIIGTIVRLGGATVAVRDRHLIKNTLVFVKELNNGSISKEKLENHKKKLEKNEDKMRLELEHILLFIDRINRTSKTIVLANFYKAYINEEIEFGWHDLCFFVELLDSFSMYDIETLKEIHDKKRYLKEDKIDGFSLQKLSGLGLVTYFNGMLAGTGKGDDYYATSNELGDIFFKLGFEESFDTLMEIIEKGIF